MNHKNVIVHNSRVTVVQPFQWLGALVATAAYGLILYALYEDGFLRRPTAPAYPVTFAVSTLVWLWYMAKRRVVTTFDAAGRTVWRKNILWREKTLRFEDVAAVPEVGYKEGCSTGVYFRIATRKNPHGKGYRLTHTYSGADLELAYMRASALPAIHHMMGLEEKQDGPDETAALESPTAYSKAGGQYTIRFWPNILFHLVLGSAIAAAGVYTNNYWTMGIGGLFLLFAFFRIASVTLDADTGMVRAFNLFGLRESRAVPFSDYEGVETTRHSYMGIYTGTVMEIRFSGKHKNVPLAAGYFTGRFGPLATETEAIIRTSRHLE